jgi:glycolate oxidase
MIYNDIDESFINELKTILGEQNVHLNNEVLSKYSHDETEDLIFYPEVVVTPENTQQISQLMRLCNHALIPVTPRAAGTGLSGGALPVKGGVVLSVEKLNKILSVDENNFQVTVEPGVITEVLQNTVKEKGLFYPPDPASKGSCFIGGNIAENSGGPKAVKYGVTKDYILNLEVVLPNGDVIWTGANTLKNATGYNLTQLIVGSEGTLGIVTKAVLRLLPYPKYNLLMLVPFKKMDEAAQAVSEIFKAGIIPSGMEFMERDALIFGKQYIDAVKIPINNDDEAHLLIEVDGNNLDVLYQEVEQISQVLDVFAIGEILFADSEAQKNELWRLRRGLGEAVKRQSVYKEEDTVVPRAHLPELLKGVKQIGKQYGFRSVCYGHAGDGNLHVNILKDNMTDDKWQNELPKAIAEIFKLCKNLGGTISGEHGIGLVQKNYLPLVFSESEMLLQKQIKELFDPNLILNPGKMFV